MFGEHQFRALGGFLCRLKQKTKVLRRPGLPQHCSSCQKHGHMGVVAAGVHHTGMPGTEAKTFRLRHWQCVHVSPENNPGSARVYGQISGHTAAGIAPGGVTSTAKLLKHIGRSFPFLAGALRDLMQRLIIGLNRFHHKPPFFFCMNSL